MRRSKRLQVVLELAQRKEEAALKSMQSAKSNLDRQQAKLQELAQYQQEYQQALRDAYRHGATAANCATYQHFLAQVGDAIEQQQSVVIMAEQQLEQSRAQWRLLHEKQRGMVGLVDRYRVEEDREMDKKEQKMIDEISQRRNPGR